MANYDAWRAAVSRAAYLRSQFETVFRQRVAFQSQRDTLFAQQGARQDAAYKAVEAQLAAASAQEEALKPQIAAADAEAAANEPSLDEKRTRACADAAAARSANAGNHHVTAQVAQAVLDADCRQYGGTYTLPNGEALGAPLGSKAKGLGEQVGTLALLASPLVLVGLLVKFGD